MVPVSGSARMPWPSRLFWRQLLPHPACCCCWMAGLVLGRACPLHSCTVSSYLCLGTRRLCACEGEFAYCMAGTQLASHLEASTPCTDCCMHACMHGPSHATARTHNFVDLGSITVVLQLLDGRQYLLEVHRLSVDCKSMVQTNMVSCCYIISRSVTLCCQ